MRRVSWKGEPLKPFDLSRFEALHALRHPKYRRIWLAQLVSQGGMWMQITARAILVYAITGEASALGIIYLASYGPSLVISLFGGALADRIDRRSLVIASNVLQGLFAAAFGLLAALDIATLLNLSILSVVAGSFQTVASPASSALVPALVPREDLASAISLQSAAMSVTRVLGPMAAAAIIPIWGVAFAFYVNALSYAFPTYAWWRTKIDSPPLEREGKTLTSIAEGLRFVSKTPTIGIPLIMVLVLSALGLVYQPFAVAYATDVLGDGDRALGDRYYGILQAAIGIGAGIGVLAFAALAKRRAAAVSIGTGLAFAASLSALAFIDGLGPALLVGALIGAFHFSNAAILQTIVQYESPEAMRGRVMSVFMIAHVGFFPFASTALGYLADWIGLQTTFLACGIACAACCVGLWPWRRHFRMVV